MQLGDKLATRNLFILMAFNLGGAAGLTYLFGLISWYTLGGVAVIIAACTLAGNFLYADLRRKGLVTDD